MKRKLNWLLYGLIGGSLLLHGAVLLYADDFYRPKAKATTCIELTMCDITPAAGRDIPHPPARLASPRLPAPPRHIVRTPKPAVKLPLPADIPTHRVEKIHTAEIAALPEPHHIIRTPKPAVKVPLPADIPAHRVEKVHPVKIAALPEPQTAKTVIEKTPPQGDGAEVVRKTIPSDKSAENHSGEDDGRVRRNYLTQVRIRIERHKRYPTRARIRQLQGEVTIRFVITPSGDIQALAVSKSSGREALDRAALKAVRAASPFLRPPENIFNGEIPLELTIVFRLT